FFFRAEDGIRVDLVSGVQACALPISRLALDAGKCIRCGMCMTGCPYGLIYSTTQTFDALRRAGIVTFCSGFLALTVMEKGPQARSEERRVGKECGYRGEADETEK